MYASFIATQTHTHERFVWSVFARVCLHGFKCAPSRRAAEISHLSWWERSGPRLTASFPFKEAVGLPHGHSRAEQIRVARMAVLTFPNENSSWQQNGKRHLFIYQVFRRSTTGAIAVSSLVASQRQRIICTGPHIRF